MVAMVIKKTLFFGCHSSQPEDQKMMYLFYAFHYTEQSLKISEQTKKSLLRKNVANAKFSILRKKTFKLKVSTICQV